MGATTITQLVIIPINPHINNINIINMSHVVAVLAILSQSISLSMIIMESEFFC